MSPYSFALKMSRLLIMAVVVCSAAILLSSLFAYSSDKIAGAQSGQIVKDDYYHFQLKLPAVWKVKTATNADSQIRLSAVADGNKKITLYALHSKLMIDPKKLADESSKLLKGEGTLESKINIPDSFFVPWLVDEKGIIKTYKNRDIFTVLFVQAEGPYGYIAVLRGPDDKELREVMNSFKATVPIKESGYAFVNYMSVFILAALLGESGFSFRKRLIKLRILKIMTMKEPASENIKKERLKTVSMLCIAPLWCLFLYLAGTYFLESITRSIFIVVGPMLPIFGYFGIIREPPDV